jgi:predicted Rossmann fold nucleotide-binding protein DprA/Smf involved in DNA uptake
MKLAIVGSREYKNENKIRKFLELVNARYGDKLVVVSGGCPNGADFLAKKVALDMELQYVEFPPIHSGHNCYCILPAENYNKPYKVSNFFTRNTQIAEFCDYLAAFVVHGIKANGTMDTATKAKKMGKRVFIYKDGK